MKSLLLIMTLIWSSAIFSKMTVQVEPNKVKQGETFRLVFSIDNQRDQGVPDLTPLQRDFSILGTQRSVSYSIINGQTNASNQWIILLSTNKTGEVPIPAITIGQQKSLPTAVKVVKGNVQIDEPIAVTSNNEVLLKTETSPKEAFINQQILYTVKLYNSQRVMDAEYLPPRVEDALIMPLGESKRKEVILDGRNYLVEEQQYAIFPQKAGKLTIAPPTFSALIFSGVPHKVTVHGDTSKVQIKPTPTHTGKYWLPAKQLALTESYDQHGEVMNEGGALVRKVTLQASGIPAELLPPLKFNNSEQFSAYPEKPELINGFHQDKVIGKIELKITYILNKAGDVTLPGLALKWFNTDTGKEETATLPERTIRILPKFKAPTTKKKPVVINEVKESGAPNPKYPSQQLGWWVAAFFAVSWLVTLFWKKKSPSLKKNYKDIIKAIHKACLQNKAQTTEKALLKWARYSWPQQNILNLTQISSLVPYAPFRQELLILSGYLYGSQQSTPWNGTKLWQTFQEFNKLKNGTITKKDDLPPMNL